MAKKKAKKKSKKKAAVKSSGKTAKAKGKPRGRGKPFVKGQSGNPAGRPKGTMQRTIMFKALEKVEKAQGLTIFEHAWKMAYTDTKVLVAMLKKIVPDMAYIEGDAGQTLTDIFAAMVGNGKPR